MGAKPPPPGSKLLLPPRDEVVLKPSFAVAVLAGGFASATVDVTIFPLDSLKTRLQAPQGFQRAGGTTGLFRGVLAAAVGAMPGGAVFFGVYEYTRHVAQGGATSPHWTTDAVAATIAATASCIVRNPAVVVTQRMQVGQYGTLPSAVATMWRTEGAMGFYAGLQVSVLRELPFAFIQFPLYESLKRLLRRSQQHEISASQGAAILSISQRECSHSEHGHGSTTFRLARRGVRLDLWSGGRGGDDAARPHEDPSHAGRRRRQCAQYTRRDGARVALTPIPTPTVTLALSLNPLV